MSRFLLAITLMVCSSLEALAVEQPEESKVKQIYKQSFETAIETNPEIQWVTSGYPVTQAVVTHNPQDGSKSVRGNFNPDIIDPITKMKGEPFTQFKINFNKLPAVKKYLLENDKVYVSWWYKLDECLWKGTDFANTDPLQARLKFAYIRMGENPATSYYFAFQGGSQGTGVFQANNDKWISYWQDKNIYGTAALWTQTGFPYGPDGKWHKISFFINKAPVSGQKYLMWFMDEKLMKKEKYEIDSKYRIVDEFKMDSIQFWITNKGNLNTSEKKDTADNFCNGWQIDNVEIFDDMPFALDPPGGLSATEIN